MINNAISFDNLPQAVCQLMSDVSELKSLLVAAYKPAEISRRTPIGIDDVCILTGKAKPTIYALVRKRVIPCYKAGKKLYFYEDEVLAWINGGKRKTGTELRAEADSYSQNKRR